MIVSVYAARSRVVSSYFCVCLLVQCEAVRFLILCHAAVPKEKRGDVLAVSLPLLVCAIRLGGEAGGLAGVRARKYTSVHECTFSMCVCVRECTCVQTSL